MPIQPLDLQTLFARMNQISREQAQLRNAEVHNQATAGKEIEQKTMLKRQAVQQSEEIQDGPEKVHDDDEAKQEYRHSKQHSSQEETDESEKDSQLHDPALGMNIDVSG